VVNRTGGALKIKALLKLPGKRARIQTYINQVLAVAMALVARTGTDKVNFALHQEICA
jgi:hypothetical protein